MTTWLEFPTTQLRWDIFEPGWTETNWTWPLVSGQNGYVGSATRVKDPDGRPGRTEDFPFVDVPRDGHDVFVDRWRSPAVDYKWLGRVRRSNGTYFDIEPGRYR